MTSQDQLLRFLKESKLPSLEPETHVENRSYFRVLALMSLCNIKMHSDNSRRLHVWLKGAYT